MALKLLTFCNYFVLSHKVYVYIYLLIFICLFLNLGYEFLNLERKWGEFYFYVSEFELELD